jgi:hypothetical protein
LNRHIEELTLSAWPALEKRAVRRLDALLLRGRPFQPLYPSTLSPRGEDRDLYAARGQETVLEVTSGAQDSELDVQTRSPS